MALMFLQSNIIVLLPRPFVLFFAGFCFFNSFIGYRYAIGAGERKKESASFTPKELRDTDILFYNSSSLKSGYVGIEEKQNVQLVYLICSET